ncbi:MAG: Rrf2 family transcriptional regulator [Polyangia bacterium]|jgi:Rrf2 family iron-sulfur cluster assembly transcriptional regulator|nr:Rrf2 family transcriptional regulator [Polyangia bacterium]
MTTILNISDAASLALHAMAYIASRPEGVRCAVGDVAEVFDLSAAHLSKVLQRLTQLGFLESRRGPGGGFILARPADRITLLEVLEAMDGAVLRRTCLLRHQVCEPGECMLGDLVTDIQARARDFLAGTRLSSYSGRRFGPRDTIREPAK